MWRVPSAGSPPGGTEGRARRTPTSSSSPDGERGLQPGAQTHQLQTDERSRAKREGTLLIGPLRSRQELAGGRDVARPVRGLASGRYGGSCAEDAHLLLLARRRTRPATRSADTPVANG